MLITHLKFISLYLRFITWLQNPSQLSGKIKIFQLIAGTQINLKFNIHDPKFIL